nr:SDR family oxidoreductase [Pseudomonas syringae]
MRGAMLSIGLDLAEKGIKVGSILPTATDTQMLRKEAIEGGATLYSSLHRHNRRTTSHVRCYSCSTNRAWNGHRNRANPWHPVWLCCSPTCCRAPPGCCKSAVRKA